MKEGKDYEKQREKDVRKAKRKEIKKHIRHKICPVTIYEFLCQKTFCSDEYSPPFKGKGKAVKKLS
jgi:hypothetical protein